MEHQMYAVENASPLRRKDKNDENPKCEKADNLASRRRSTPVSTVLRKSVGFLINEITYFNKNKTFQVEIWPISCVYNSETQERGLWAVYIQKIFQGRACPGPPLEGGTLGAHLENRSVFILDLHLKSK